MVRSSLPTLCAAATKPAPQGLHHAGIIVQRTIRDEFLNTELFTTTTEARILADLWRREYNTLRPH
ncbi:MAG: hypothetical protein ERJ69_07115 [Aphanocapsa feldmannii 288cV]|nr:MAG: hypothetical protein ERJ69_07115 [Aphanocapsa feldmannii 288cV]